MHPMFELALPVPAARCQAGALAPMGFVFPYFSGASKQLISESSLGWAKLGWFWAPLNRPYPDGVEIPANKSVDPLPRTSLQFSAMLPPPPSSVRARLNELWMSFGDGFPFPSQPGIVWLSFHHPPSPSSWAKLARLQKAAICIAFGGAVAQRSPSPPPLLLFLGACCRQRRLWLPEAMSYYVFEGQGAGKGTPDRWFGGGWRRGGGTASRYRASL